MRGMTRFYILAISVGMFSAGCGPMHVAVGIGGPPLCPYGYYEVSPYNCAPDGYYGPEWFSGGVFIGAGPFYRGPGRFYGHVDHDLAGCGKKRIICDVRTNGVVYVICEATTNNRVEFSATFRRSRESHRTTR
jgi:hypothetical protein